ncbi:hypothetical protein D3C76_1106460 [compost metagenome]
MLELVKTNKYELTKWIDYKTNKISYMDQSSWYNPKNEYKISLPLDEMDKKLNEKIRKFKTLEDYFPGKSLRTCCALTGRTEDFIVDKDKETKNLIFPYIEGSKGIPKKFSKPLAYNYIEYDYDLQIKISDEFKSELEKLGVKNKKRVTLGDKEIYVAPKIFIRQSSMNIMCTYTEDNYAANNSIYVLSSKKYDENSKKMLKYVCGLLNSNLITYYARINNIIRYGIGKTPQIKISDFKTIRIVVNNEYYDEIIELVEKLLENKNCNENLKKLNHFVYKIYDISNEEIVHIENTILKA